MTVLDTIVYFGRLKGMDAASAKKEAERLIERFGLSEWTKSMVEKLSKGMSQKVQVAAAMVNHPRLLILDEPFSGLDPVNQKVLEDLVLEMAKADLLKDAIRDVDANRDEATVLQARGLRAVRWAHRIPSDSWKTRCVSMPTPMAS